MATIIGNNRNNILSGTNSSDTILGRDGNDVIDARSGNDRIGGGSGNDQILGGSGNDRIDGGRDNDQILGGTGNDFVDGGSGNDFVDGGSGNDVIDGGSGNDQILGGDGNDIVDGGSGNDFVDGGSGNDVIDGGSGNDIVDGGSGNDFVNGGSGNDSIDGGSGNDLLFGGSGNDIVDGGSGNDFVDGGSGNDVVGGGTGNDLLFGGAGDDALIGGAGADQLTGGSGSDRFVFLGASDSPAASGWDRITDFTQGRDKIDLAAFRNIPSDLDLVWRGEDPAVAGPWGVWYHNSAISTFVHADTSGDGIADLTIELRFTPGLNLAVTDFIGVSDAPVTDINDAPVINSNGGGDTAAVSVAENATAVTAVTASDPDALDTRIFSISGGADAALFSINSTTGALSFVSAPNFEAPIDVGANNIYDVTVRVADSGGMFDTQAIAVTVTDTNDVAPAITSGATGSEAENAPTSNVVYDANATDPDTVGTVAFSLTGTDAGLFSINSATGEVTFLASPDFEAPADADTDNVYNLVVHANDGVQDTTQAVTIAVTDTNDVAPAITSGATGSEAENAPTSNVVYDANATDPDTVGTVAFSLTGTDAGLFSINSATGEVTFLASPDFEAPADADTDNVYNLVVHANDGVQDTTQAVTIAVTDTNDVAPAITSGATGSEAENAPTSNVVYDANATDPDTVGTVAFSLTGTDAGLFSINSATGEVTFLASPDFEAPADADTDNVYNLVVHANDGVQDTTQAVTIAVTDTNDVAPAITSGATGSEAENAPTSNVVYDANATDPDTVGTVAFSLTGTDAGLFSINSATGEVTFLASPDFEAPADADTDNVYNLVVHANDGVQDTTQAVTIAVTDTNDVAPAITSGATGSEAENAPTSNVVYDANATDPDTVGTVAFSLTGTDAGLFSINSATGEVTFLASPDFEAPADADTDNVYNLVVHANDGVQDTTQAVTIAVTDTNDVAPAITSGATGSEAENAPTSNVVYDANATDPDTVGTVAFSLTGTDAGLFSINSATGEVTFLASPDFEAPADADTDNVYNLVVHANDGVQDTTQAVTIAVTDVNYAPVITSHGGGPFAFVTVTENNTVVNTATATDPDAGEPLTFSIVGGADMAQFSIDPATGVLSFNDAPDFGFPADVGGDNVYDVVVQVSDEHGATDTQSIAVTVTENLPPMPEGDNVITNVSRNQLVNIPEWALLANDSDPNGDPIDVLDVGATGGGTATHTLGTGTDGYVTFIPNNSDEGGSFAYRAMDVWGAASSLSGVNVTLDRDGDLDGTLDNDILVVGLNSGAKRVVGIDGNDILVGGRGNDTLSGGVGDDTLDGGAGIDLLDFSEVSTSFSFTLGADGSGSATVNGTDTYWNMEGVIGGSGNDSLTGNVGDNILQGGAGNDTLTGGEGVDLLDYSNNTTGFSFTLAEGGSGIATVDGSDTYQNMEGVVGGSGDDSLTGNTGGNILQGGAGSDMLTGGDGSDILTGGNGSDTLVGDNGSDILTGGNGSDTLTGGDGNDIFDYNSFADADDTITDFSKAEGDKLDLHDLLTLIGAPDHMSAFDDGYLKLAQVGDDTLVQFGDGTGSAESFQTLVTLSGVTLTSIDTTDFIL